MHRYRVYLTCASARQVVLRDYAGRYHLARIASALPPLWEELEGDAPALGFGMLSTSSGRVFRAFFDAVNVEQHIDLLPPRAVTSA